MSYHCNENFDNTETSATKSVLLIFSNVVFVVACKYVTMQKALLFKQNLTKEIRTIYEQFVNLLYCKKSNVKLIRRTGILGCMRYICL